MLELIDEWLVGDHFGEVFTKYEGRNPDHEVHDPVVLHDRLIADQPLHRVAEESADCNNANKEPSTARRADRDAGGVGGQACVKAGQKVIDRAVNSFFRGLGGSDHIPAPSTGIITALAPTFSNWATNSAEPAL